MLKKPSYFAMLMMLLFVFSGTAYAQSKKQAKRLPNIIYIYADDLGYSEVGCYGQQKIKTPNIDRLAVEGMRFDNHYSSSPVCAPARCMLMTGKHGGHSYIRGNYELGGFPDSLEGGQMPLPDGTFTIAHLLKNAGYATGLCGKWGLGMHNTTGSPLNQGFDYYYGFLDQKQAHNHYPSHLWENGKWDTLNNPAMYVHKSLNPATATDADFDSFKGSVYAEDKFTEKALAFIEENKQRPFFLYMPYTVPHVSLQAPEDYIDQYKGQFDEKPYYGESGYAPTKYPFSTYAAMISFLDAQVGIIMQKIKEAGLDDNTIIMFSSDNGTTFNGGVNPIFFNSVGDLRGLKMDVYEGGIKEPFIVRWPGKVGKGKSSDLICAQYDIMATFAELTGQVAKNTDGVSMLPEMLGNNNKQKHHDYLYFEYPEKGGQIAIRKGDWKGVRTNVTKDRTSPWQIYNLKEDISESNDLAAKYPELVREFESIVKKEHQPSHIKEWEFIDPKFSR